MQWDQLSRPCGGMSRPILGARRALQPLASTAGRLLAKAVAAVDRLVAAWQERNFGVLAAGGANGGVHFAPAAATAVIAPTAGSAIGSA
jgi:hypothetical protein